MFNKGFYSMSLDAHRLLAAMGVSSMMSRALFASSYPQTLSPPPARGSKIVVQLIRATDLTFELIVRAR